MNNLARLAHLKNCQHFNKIEYQKQFVRLKDLQRKMRLNALECQEIIQMMDQTEIPEMVNQPKDLDSED